jgi:hypothetical protein
VQYQHVVVPKANGSGPVTLTATVWATQPGAANPVVTVLDGAGNLLPAEILQNANGTYSVQVVGVTPGAVYTVAVAAADPTGAAAVGRYRLAVDFDAAPVALTGYASGTLTGSASQQFQVLDLTTSQFFHFLVSATTSQATPAAVKMTIYDASGNVVQSLVGQVGTTLSTTVLLGPGTYVFQFGGGTQGNGPLPDTTYQLQGTSLSDPLGPVAVMPILVPPQPPPPPPIVFTIPTLPLYLQYLALYGQYGTP